MNWLNEKEITEDSIGFIYCIYHNATGTYYIGKKNLYSFRKRNKKIVKSESNWRNYYGSSKEFTDFVKKEGKDNFTRIILKSAKSAIQLTYLELKYQILLDWESDKCYNSNLLGRIFKNKIKI